MRGEAEAASSVSTAIKGYRIQINSKFISNIKLLASANILVVRILFIALNKFMI